MHWYERRLQEKGHVNFCGQAIGADGFAAIMLKRQAASSLPALIEQTITAAELENETDMEELADSCEDEKAPKEVAKTLGSIKQDPAFQAIAQRYRELENQDSNMFSLRSPLGESLLVLIQIHFGHLFPPYCLEENSNGH
jgi:hypothetical protein